MQPARRRLLAASLVLTTGTLTALPFYRTPSSSEVTASTRANTPATAPAPVTLQLLGGESPTVPTETHSESASQEAAATQRYLKPPSPPPAAVPSPQLSQHHPAAEETVPPAFPIRRPEVDPHSPEDSWSEPGTSPRLHRIIDGDTLEELALRYLGDRARWLEIRDANRDILTDEDVLPIARQLRIPPREKNSAIPATNNLNLVPIPWNQK